MDGGLAGIAEIAALLGISRQRVNALLKSHPDFPRPLSVADGTPNATRSSASSGPAGSAGGRARARRDRRAIRVHRRTVPAV